MLTVALAGCTDSSSPAPTASVASETPSPTPTPTVPEPAPSPTLPPDITDRDVDGAEAAARYVLDLYIYTLSTQDTEPWQSVSYEGCVFCQGVLDTVAEDRDSGQVFTGGEITILEAETEKLNPSAYGVTLQVKQAPTQKWTLDGAPISAPDSGWAGWALLVMYQEGDSWYLRESQTFDHKPEA